MPSPFLLTVVGDVVIELAREGGLSELLHADESAQMSETIEAVKQEEKSCDKVETVREFTYLGDRVSACGECEAAVTVRIRCG